MQVTQAFCNLSTSITLVTVMPQAPVDALFVANHPALDFINTAYGAGGQAREVLASDADVVAWLQAAGLLEPAFDLAPRGLAKLAHELRAGIFRSGIHMIASFVGED